MPSAEITLTNGLIVTIDPGDYELVGHGVDLGVYVPRESTGGPVEIAFALEEERQSLRLFLRALRRLSQRS